MEPRRAADRSDERRRAAAAATAFALALLLAAFGVGIAAGTSLDGFEATMEPSDGGIADSLPGFGVGTAVASVAGAAALALRRRRSA